MNRIKFLNSSKTIKLSIKLSIVKLTVLLLVISGLSACGYRFSDYDDDSMYSGDESFYPDNQHNSDSASPGSTSANRKSSSSNRIVSGQAGRSMDSVDKMNMKNALEQQSDNRGSTWVNPKSNTRYTITPTSSSNSGKKYCRTYKIQTTNKNGKTEYINGRACKENGRWVRQ